MLSKNNIFDKKLNIYPQNVHPFYLPYQKSILLTDKTLNKTLISGRKFLDLCLIFVNNQSYKLIYPPKVTVIIPLYNCERTIKPSLHSVQYQNISNLEIILVNDFSIDNTSKIINYYQMNDHRIKIINNFRNMGTLYSRAIAGLLSKGEYIFSLDSDDLYFDFDVLDYIYRRAKKENLDIINFEAIKMFNYTTDINHMLNIFTYQYQKELYVKQPELGLWMIKHKGKFVLHNNIIWDKCINSLLYKKAINLIGFKRYSKYLSWDEDTCINFVIFNLAKSFKLIKKYGIIHFIGENTTTFTQSTHSKLFGEIFFLDIMFDFSKNNTLDKNLIIEQVLYIYNKYKYYNITNDKTNLFYLKFILNKIINSKYLSKLNYRKCKKHFFDLFIYKT